MAKKTKSKNTQKRREGLKVKGLAKRLIDLRLESGMTQTEVAEKLGIKSRSQVCHYELGREPCLHHVAKLAKIFSVSTDSLLGVA